MPGDAFQACDVARPPLRLAPPTRAKPPQVGGDVRRLDPGGFGECREHLGGEARSHETGAVQQGTAPARIHGQCHEQAAEGRGASVPGHGAELAQHLLGIGPGTGWQRVRQGEPVSPGRAPHGEREAREGEVRGAHLGNRVGRHRAPGGVVVAAHHGARALARGAAGTLCRRGLGGRDGDEAGDPPPGVPARLAREAGVHHEAHARDRQGGLREGCADHDPRRIPRGVARDRAVLLARGELAVQLEDLDAGAAQLGGHPGDLTGPGQEDEGVHGGVLRQGPAVRVGRRAGHVGEERGRDPALVKALRAGLPHDVERVQCGRAVHHRSGLVAAEQRGEAGCVHGRGHRHHCEVLAQLPQLGEHAHEQIRLHAALVHLVEHHGGGARQLGVREQAAQQDAGRHELHAGPRTHLALAAHAPADDVAGSGAAQRGKSARGGPRGDPPGLDDDDAAGCGGGVARHELCNDRRDHRGLTCAGWGLHHRDAAVQGLAQLWDGPREGQVSADPVQVEEGHGPSIAEGPDALVWRHRVREERLRGFSATAWGPYGRRSTRPTARAEPLTRTKESP